MRSAKAEKIPSDIFLRYKPKRYDQGDGDLKRELIAGCFVDKNNLMAIYFPHRTFQEFLVAEYVVDSLYLNYDFDELSESLVPLVNKFIVEQEGLKGASLFFEKMNPFVGSVNSSILRLIADFDASHSLISKDDARTNPWFVYSKLAAVAGVGLERMDFNASIAMFDRLDFEGLESGEPAAVATLQFYSWLASQATPAVSSDILLIIIRLLLRRSSVTEISRVLNSAKSRTSMTVDASTLTIPSALLLAMQFEVERDSRNKQVMVFPLGELSELLQSALRPRYFVRDFVLPRRMLAAVELERIYLDESLARHIDAWRAFFVRGDLRVRVAVRGEIVPRARGEFGDDDVGAERESADDSDDDDFDADDDGAGVATE